MKVVAIGPSSFVCFFAQAVTHCASAVGGGRTNRCDVREDETTTALLAWSKATDAMSAGVVPRWRRKRAVAVPSGAMRKTFVW